MKRLYILISVLFILPVLFSCKGQAPTGSVKQAVTTVSPSALISTEEAAPFLSYQPYAETESGRKKSSVLYRSEPKGKGDTIKVEVYQPTPGFTAEAMRQQFDTNRKMRPSAAAAEGLGAEAFIAYPSIHLYTEECYIIITAGSGSDEAQTELLKSLAAVALENLPQALAEKSAAK